MKIVVVGYGSAGLSAADYARVFNRKAEIVVFEKRSYAIYHPCSLPDALSGLIPSLEMLKESAPKMPRFTVYTSTLVEEINSSTKKVFARNLKNGEKIEVEYDKLILATGSKPFIPRSMRIEDDAGVYLLKYVEDAESISQAAKKYKRVVVVGGGFIGIETAHALRKRGLEVTLIEYFNQLMPGKLDPDIAIHVENALREEGINVVLGKGVTEITGPEGNKKISTSDQEYTSDFVVVATGVRPDTSLAKSVGLEVGEKGGIKVDEYMRTSNPDIYAAGDNVEVPEIVTGKPVLSLLGSTAVKMGRIAGINAAGGNIAFKGVVNVWIVNIGSLQFGAAGLTLETAKREGIDAIAVTISAPEKLAIYPDAGELTVRLIVERESGLLIGGQVLGPTGVLDRLNMLAIALMKKMNVEELAELETAYTPSLCDVIDPLHVAADAALRRLRRG